MTSLPSVSLPVSLSLSLSLSLSHRALLTHNIGSAFALPKFHKKIEAMVKNQALIITKIDALNKGQNMHIFFLLTHDWLFCVDV